MIFEVQTPFRAKVDTVRTVIVDKNIIPASLNGMHHLDKLLCFY